MDRIFYLDHAPIDFHFRQTPETFVVEEVPLYPFSGEGEHLIAKVRKKELTTWEMLQALSERTGVKVRDIGYAGLKDKNALTYQYVSLPAKYEEALERFEHPKIKILETTRHKNKIRIGHLKGNRFFIRLKKVSPLAAKKIDEVLKKIDEFGMPNYFGYQRFGTEGDNYELGRKVVEGELEVRDRKLRRLYINAYQSHLFNLWLSKRIEHSKLLNAFEIKELANIFDLPKDLLKELKAQPHFFKIYPGDVMTTRRARSFTQTTCPRRPRASRRAPSPPPACCRGPECGAPMTLPARSRWTLTMSGSKRAAIGATPGSLWRIWRGATKRKRRSMN